MRPTSTLALPPLPSGWQALHHAILADGTLAVIITDVDLAGEWARIRASESRVDPPSRIQHLAAIGRARLLTAEPAGWREALTLPLETPHPLLERFADGRWLIVGARARGEPNARVLAPDGALLSRFMLGDGIEHIAVDSSDRIWVGWFDEGIFGSGWQVPGLEWPPSSNGVACFTADGGVAELPSWPEQAGIIADCYALTAAGSGVWTSPYVDFPLVRFEPGEPARWWRHGRAGARAIAVDRDRALIAGGYGDDAARIALLHLAGRGDGDEAVLLAAGRMPLRAALPSPHGWAPVWQAPACLVGRGDVLHLVDDGRWHRWRLADVAAGA